ncbi:hypothetical protein ACVGXS_25720, partial [Enterobacter hormaechei]
GQKRAERAEGRPPPPPPPPPAPKKKKKKKHSVLIFFLFIFPARWMRDKNPPNPTQQKNQIIKKKLI